MSDSYDMEHAEQTQRAEWTYAGEHQMEGQQLAEQSGGAAPDGSTGGYKSYGPSGVYGASGASDGGQHPGWEYSNQPVWGYNEQSGGSGAGWGYAPPYAHPYTPPAAPRVTSRPLPGAAEPAGQDVQVWTGGYAGGYYGPTSQPMQPFQPPQSPQSPYGAYGSYGSYGPASGTWGAPGGGYGSYGPASQYGGYGQYGSPSQYGGYGQYGQPSQWGPPVAIEAPARRPWSMRLKLAVFGGLAALLLVLAGGGLGYMQYNAPTAAANQICSDFQSQRYVDMYGLFDAQMQARMTSVQFAQAVLDIDRAEGQTVKCEASIHANGFSDSSAVATLVLTRPNVDGLQGIARLKNEGGAWKVTALDQSLFGLDLRALNGVDSYCAALLGQTYDAAYGMLDQAQQGKQKAADFRQDATWRDEIDGNVTACHVAAIGANNNSTASMTLSVARSRASEHQGTIMLALEGTSWKIHSVADEALGRDIGPIRTDTRFCNDLATGNFGDMATLFSGLVSAGDLARSTSDPSRDFKMTNCSVDTSTYQLSGSSVSLVNTFTLVSLSTGNAAGSGPIKFIFTRFGHDWKISGMARP